MAGYWRDEEATELTIRDGWLATGDLGTLDDDGYLTIVGRKKWMLKRGGENVSPDEVEAALIRHGAISEVVVVGVPDDVMGERVAAIVVIQPGATLSPDELRAWALGHLAAFKVPDLYVVTARALPKNGVGKIDVARLKSDAREGRIAWVDVRQGA
jgi:acyl-CoA synthetase (AMP-forming)/AMP-acid ligase II